MVVAEIIIMTKNQLKQANSNRDTKKHPASFCWVFFCVTKLALPPKADFSPPLGAITPGRHPPVHGRALSR